MCTVNMFLVSDTISMFFLKQEQEFPFSEPQSTIVVIPIFIYFFAPPLDPPRTEGQKLLKTFASV